MRTVLLLVVICAGCSQSVATPPPVVPAEHRAAAPAKSFTVGPPLATPPSAWVATFSTNALSNGPVTMGPLNSVGGLPSWSGGVGVSATGVGPGRAFHVTYAANGTMNFSVIETYTSSGRAGIGGLPRAAITGAVILVDGSPVVVDLTPIP